MMVWNPNVSVGFRDDSDVVTEGAAHQIKGKERGIPAIQFLLDAVADVVARLSMRSVAVALVLALVVAAILFGLSADDASAVGLWCRKCE